MVSQFIVAAVILVLAYCVNTLVVCRSYTLASRRDEKSGPWKGRQASQVSVPLLWICGKESNLKKEVTT
jgi:hypothetical protein